MAEISNESESTLNGADLPNGWSLPYFGDVCDFQGGTQPPKDVFVYRPQAGYVRLLQIRDFESDQHATYIPEETKLRLVSSGDVLIGRYGASVGKILRGLSGAINVAIVRTIPSESNLSKNFLYYLLQGSPFQHFVKSLGGRSAQAGFNKGELSRFLIGLPPFAEQQAIAHVLRTVQRAKEATEKVIAAARQLKQSLMRHLFTYGPVPVEQADKVPQRETDYGAVPEKWKTMPLNECAVVQTGVAKGRKLNSAEAISVPYLRVANVQDGYLDLSEIKTIEIRRSELSRFSLEAGDVVLTEGGDFDKLGRGFIWNGEVPGCVHQNHIFAVRAKRDMLMSDFLAYLTQSDYGKGYFLSVAHKTTNLACINTTKLKALPTLLPSMEEQQEIIKAIRGVDGKIAVEVSKRNALDALFRTLLHDLMTGKVRVNELEFPASAEGVL